MKDYIALFNSSNQNAPISLCTAGVTLADPTYYVTNRQRTTSEFEYIIAGKGTVRCNDKEYHVKAGDIFHLPRGCSFECFPDKNDPWIKIWVNAFGDLIPNIMQSYRLHDIVIFPDAPYYDYFKKILKVCRNNTLTIEEKGEDVSLLLHELVIALYKFMTENRNIIKQKQDDAHIIKTYLDNHVSDNVSMSDLSALIFRSDSQAIRVFKNAYGITPYNYLLRIRISSAQQLLEQTNLSVKEIAFSLGFSDEHYFSHLFKTKTGKTPTNYRKTVFKKSD